MLYSKQLVICKASMLLCNKRRSTFYSVIVTNHFMKYLFLFLQFLLKNTGTPFRFTRLNQIKTSSGHARLSVKLSRRLTVRTQNEEQSKSCLQHLLCMHSNRTEYKLTENTNAINHSTQGSGLKVLEKRERKLFLVRIKISQRDMTAFNPPCCTR